MPENTSKVCLNDIMSVLSDPSVIPSLRGEREVVAARLGQIDRMLSILEPVARDSVPVATRPHASGMIPSKQALDAVVSVMRRGVEHHHGGIAKASGYTAGYTLYILRLLVDRNVVATNGAKARNARWWLA